MVSVLDSGSRGTGSSPGWGIVLCSWARHFTLRSINGYRRNAGGLPAMD